MPNVCISIYSRINNVCNGIINRENERNAINSLCKVLDIQERNLSVCVNAGTTDLVNAVAHLEHVKSF